MKSQWLDFKAFVKDKTIEYPHQVTEAIVGDYLAYLKSKGCYVAFSYKRGKKEIKNAKTNKSLSNRSINDYLATFKLIFSILERKHIVIENPFEHFEKLKNDTINREAFTTEELEIIGKKAQGTYLYSLILVGFCTGLRLGDIANLKWSIVDLDNRLIGGDSYDAKQRKTGNSINIPIVPPLALYLSTLERYSSYVFPELHKILRTLKGF